MSAFLSFRGGVAENSVLLGCDADLMGKGTPTFRGTVLRSKQRDVIYPLTQVHIPEA